MLNDFIKQHLLVFSSIGSDHEIFFNTPNELMNEIKNSIKMQMYPNTNLAVLTFTKEESDEFEKILQTYNNNNINTPSRINPEYQKRAMASALFRTKLMLAILESHNDASEETLKNIEALKSIQSGFFALSSKETRSESYLASPTNWDIENELKNTNKTQLAIFATDIKCNELQGAINNYIGSRTPYSIKLFTNLSQLKNNYDSSGNLVSPIHDYRAIYLDKYLDKDEPTLE